MSITTSTHAQTPTRVDIEALFDPMCAAWNAGDPDGTAAMYGEDGRLIDPFGMEHTGRDAIVKAFKDNFAGLLAGSTTELTVDSMRELTPGFAVVDAWQTFTGELPRMHVVLVVRGGQDRAEVVECRPYVVLELPPA